MKLSRAISIASQWAEGHLVNLRYGEGEAYHKLCIKALKLMKEQTVTNCHQLNGWISVEDRLPEDMGNVLVFAFWHEHWQTMYGWCRKEDATWFVYTSHGEMRPGPVTHWMPLPEPPEVDV